MRIIGNLHEMQQAESWRTEVMASSRRDAPTCWIPVVAVLKKPC